MKDAAWPFLLFRFGATLRVERDVDAGDPAFWENTHKDAPGANGCSSSVFAGPLSQASREEAQKSDVLRASGELLRAQ